MYRGREINLTATEGLILSHLATNAGVSVSHASLSEAVWGEDFPGAAKGLKVYINRLRAKLEENHKLPELIVTKPGFGYQLTKKN
jgi:two-component system KDP operon response regulator KdpE